MERPTARKRPQMKPEMQPTFKSGRCAFPFNYLLREDAETKITVIDATHALLSGYFIDNELSLYDAEGYSPPRYFVAEGFLNETIENMLGEVKEEGDKWEWEYEHSEGKIHDYRDGWCLDQLYVLEKPPPPEGISDADLRKSKCFWLEAHLVPRKKNQFY